MTRDQKIAKARELRERGVRIVEIAASLGVTHGTISKWLNPDRAREYNRRDNERPGRSEAKRRYAQETDWNCPGCARPMSRHSRYSGVSLCRDCEFEKRRHAHRERDEQIVEWWADGLTLREIADRLGWSLNHMRRESDRLRRAGYSLPYRYRLVTPRYPEQVAA